MSSNFKYNVYNDLSTTNIIIVGNPQISYFSAVYRKYTYFSIDKRESHIINNGNNNKTFVMQDNGGVDLLLNISIMFDINVGNIIPSNIGTTVIDNVNYYVSRSINNPQFVLEKLSGSYINILNNLSNPLHPNSFYEKKNPGEYHIVSGNLCNILSGSGGVFNNNSASGTIKKIIVPLPFSFSNNSGNAIPIILFGHNYNLIFSTKIKNDYIDKIEEFKYIYTSVHLFDNEERQRFLNNSNEYIYTRVYELNIIDNTLPYYDIPTYDLYNNIKSIIWVTTNNYKYNISINNLDLFNSIDNFLDKEYFTKIFPKKAGLVGCGKKLNASNIVDSNEICYYTFGLKDTYDNEDTPSGSINSSINQVRIKSNNYIDFNTLYLECYNILIFEENKAPRFMFSQKQLQT